MRKIPRGEKPPRPRPSGVIGWKPEADESPTMRLPLTKGGLQIYDDMGREVVSSSMSRFRGRDDAKNLDQIVNGMNLLWDMAKTLPKGELRDKIRRIFE